MWIILQTDLALETMNGLILIQPISTELRIVSRFMSSRILSYSDELFVQTLLYRHFSEMKQRRSNHLFVF
jgi:hypothetical protein